MFVRGLGLLVVTLLILGDSVFAQEPEIPDHPRVSFPSRPDVIVELNDNSKSVRGRLANLTSVEIMINRGKGQGDQPIKMERIKSLKSVDGFFQFTGDEDIKDITQRAIDSYSAIKIDGPGGRSYVPRGGKGKHSKFDDEDEIVVEPQRPNRTEKTPKSGANKTGTEKMPPGNSTPRSKSKGLGNGGFGGLGNLPKNSKSKDDEAGSSEDQDSEMASEEDDSSESSASGELDEFLCSVCSKEIPQSAMKKGVCPHCRATFAVPKVASSTPQNDPFGKTGGTPVPGTGNAFAPTGAPLTAQGAPGVGPAVPAVGQAPSSTVVVQNTGFSFDQVPNWAKGGIFILVILVGYHLLFNR